MAAMTGPRKKLASLGLALLAIAALTGLVAVLWRGMAERDSLQSRNDAERAMNVLYARLRDHADFGAAIESDAALRERILGVAAYAADGSRLYAWGEAPASVARRAARDDAARDDAARDDAARDDAARDDAAEPGDKGRLYIDNPANDSIILVSRSFGPRPPRKPDGYPEPQNPPPRDASAVFFFETLRDADSIALEIRAPEYWMRRRLEAVLFPAVAVALGALALFVRALLLRNAEYRARIEEQRSLVVLGTAASTLAHEIKNPLLSIKLQARILEKTCPDSARREIGIISDEVDRLSALSHRVGDYLRDPAGNPAVVDVRDMARDVGERLCGRDVLVPSAGPAPLVRMDPERLRSVLENLVRNAIESGTEGSGADGVSIEARVCGSGSVVVDVLDRGSGLSAEAAARLFDPFFTTKSRGTGIGLSICRRFAEAAGGSVALEQRTGGGCRARLSLPAADAGPEEAR